MIGGGGEKKKDKSSIMEKNNESYTVVIDSRMSSFNLVQTYVGYLLAENGGKHFFDPRFKKNYQGEYKVNYCMDAGLERVPFEDSQIRVEATRREDKIVGTINGTDVYTKIVLSVEGDQPDTIKDSILTRFLVKAKQHDQENSGIDRPFIEVKKFGGAGWFTCKEQRKRPIETIFLPKDFTDSILNTIKSFRSEEEDYFKFGKPHKLVLLFYGPPGLGKSSLASTIAGCIGDDLAVYELDSRAEDSKLESGVQNLPEKSILLIEDIDAAIKNSDGKLTLTGISNVLDGIKSKGGMIIILTTNHIEEIDPVLIRPGRVNKMFEFKLPTPQQIESMILYHFSEQKLDSIKCRQIAEKLSNRRIPTCTITEFLFENRKSDNILDLVTRNIGKLTTMKKFTGLSDDTLNQVEQMYN